MASADIDGKRDSHGYCDRWFRIHCRPPRLLARRLYEITVTVSDDDGDSQSATIVAYVTGVGINNHALQVVGTDGNGRTFVRRIGRDQLLVTANFLSSLRKPRTLDSRAVSRIEIVLGDGDDLAVINPRPRVLQPAISDGGAGNDILKGGRADDILLAGSGSDFVRGGPGSDLLIAGQTACDFSDEALLTILDGWTTQRSPAARIANLQGLDESQFTDRLNGDYFFCPNGDDQTVFDDEDPDLLFGGSGIDWFFAHLRDDNVGLRDRLFGARDNETADDLARLLTRWLMAVRPLLSSVALC